MHPLQEQERLKRDREARAYDSFFPRWRNDAETHSVVRRVRRLPGRERMTVVDLGTGTGRIAMALAGLVERVIGIDFSAASIEVARSAAPSGPGTRYEFAVGDVLATGLPDACADAVTCAQVLQHMPTEDARDGLLLEAERLLRPGGVFLLTCYGRNLLHRLRDARESVQGGLYVYRHSRAELRSRLGARFAAVRVDSIVGLPDWLPFPRLDSCLSRVPGWSLFGRTLLGAGARHSTEERAP